MVSPVMLCGTMFHLPIWRHRYFEMNPSCLLSPASCCHSEMPLVIHPGSNARKARKMLAFEHKSERLYADSMGCQWMTVHEAREAIPPAYCEFIGARLLRALAVDEIPAGELGVG